MTCGITQTLSGITLAVFILATPAQADGLLGGLVSLGSGQASDSALVNVGIGGGGNVLDVNIGGSRDIAKASVGTGNGVGAGVSLLGSNGVDADVNLLGGGNLLSARVGVGGLGVDVGVGGRGTPGTPGNPGNPGVPGNPVIPGGGGAVASAAGLTAADLACMGPDGAQLLKLAGKTTDPRRWRRASNVEVVPVQVCPQARRKLSTALRQTGMGPGLWQAVAGDTLIQASLGRTRYESSDVFAVRQQGRHLTVFVY